MKIVAVVLLFAGVALAAPQQQPRKYTNQYDHVNIRDILNSDRLLENYLKCILDEGKCAADAAELKKNIPDAISNECASCTEIQKDRSIEVLDFLIKEKPKWYDRLEAKYDPTGDYKKKYKSKAQERGIVLPP